MAELAAPMPGDEGQPAGGSSVQEEKVGVAGEAAATGAWPATQDVVSGDVLRDAVEGFVDNVIASAKKEACAYEAAEDEGSGDISKTTAGGACSEPEQQNGIEETVTPVENNVEEADRPAQEDEVVLQGPESNIPKSSEPHEQNDMDEIVASIASNTEQVSEPSLSEQNQSQESLSNRIQDIEVPTVAQAAEESSLDGNTSEPVSNGTEEDYNGADDNAALEVGQPYSYREEGEKSEEWLDVLGNGRLKKKVLQAGEGRDSRPVQGDLVTVRCKGCLDDGTEVDVHDRLTFTLGDGDVIQAFDLCVAITEKNETCQIITEALYAYGKVGRSPDIPPNARLIYELEVLHSETAPDYGSLPTTQIIEHGDAKRERGNYYYSRNEFSYAISSYQRALKILDSEGANYKGSAGELQQLLEVKVKCYNNMAAAQLKVDAYDAAVRSCDSVLKVQPENVKALFRKGKCLAAKGDITEAIQLMRKAIKFEPETKIIHQELSKLVNKQKKANESERAMYQKMLGQDKKSQAAEERQESSSWWGLYLAGAAAVALVGMGVAYKYIHM